MSIDDTDIFSLCSISNYNLFLHPRTSGRGGGVGILVHMDLQSLSISPIALSYGECISCNFRLKFNLGILSGYICPTFISSCSRSDLLTDHYLFHTSILLNRPSSTKSLMYYRDLKHLHYTDLCSRISHCLWNTNKSFDKP